MPVTELALLHLPPSSLPLSKQLKSTLLSAKHAMESFTSHKFHFFTQLQDPAYIYIIGTWDSLVQHREMWLPSEQNQTLLRELEGKVVVEWMFHVDLGEGRVVDEFLPVGEEVLSIARYFVNLESKERFESELSSKRGIIEEYVKPKRVGGGWRVEGRDSGEQEFVQFTGWGGMEHYGGFKEAEGFGEYVKIKEWTEGFEVKHAVRLEL